MTTRAMFDTNQFGILRVTQAFAPALLRSISAVYLARPDIR